LKALALCHDIVIDTATGDYNSASPDELALVNFAKQVGIQFIGHDDSDNMIIDVGEGDQEKYKLWHVCDFNSTRKRMSVIVEDQDGTIKLICKGADSIIAERLSKESLDSSIFRKSQKAVDKFANEGLRTLFVAERIIPKADFDKWFKIVKDHRILTSGREKALAEDNE
jgi:magnesium-transporting ATPase (P-type)